MSKSINILDKDYLQWVQALCMRYRQSQIKAAVRVNAEQLKYKWLLGRDIVEMNVEQRRGESVITQLGKDLRKEMPDVQGFSKTNIYYCRKFYQLYNPSNEFFHQVEGKSSDVEFLDLLFYNLNLSCYVVIEVKIGKFEFADIGQLGGYVVACNHTLRKEGRDNPTIGLLICKEKDRVQAQYALESSSQPLGISEYDLERFYPEKVEGTIPTIEEIEEKLSDNSSEELQ